MEGVAGGAEREEEGTGVGEEGVGKGGQPLFRRQGTISLGLPVLVVHWATVVVVGVRQEAEVAGEAEVAVAAGMAVGEAVKAEARRRMRICSWRFNYLWRRDSVQ